MAGGVSVREPQLRAFHQREGRTIFVTSRSLPQRPAPLHFMSRPSKKASAAARPGFVQSIGAATPFYRLFDHLPEIAFFAKDRHFRLMCASQRFLERFGFHA